MAAGEVPVMPFDEVTKDGEVDGGPAPFDAVEGVDGAAASGPFDEGGQVVGGLGERGGGLCGSAAGVAAQEGAGVVEFGDDDGAGGLQSPGGVLGAAVLVKT